MGDKSPPQTTVLVPFQQTSVNKTHHALAATIAIAFSAHHTPLSLNTLTNKAS